MAYVDFNLIRAAIAETPGTSEYISVQSRIAQKAIQIDTAAASLPSPPDIAVQPILKPFEPTTQALASIGYDLHDYLELVDYTGRAIRVI